MKNRALPIFAILLALGPAAQAQDPVALGQGLDVDPIGPIQVGRITFGSDGSVTTGPSQVPAAPALPQPASEGGIYTRRDGSAARNDGVLYVETGNTVTGSDGSRYRRVGDSLFGSDGSSYIRREGSILGSDGSVYRETGERLLRTQESGELPEPEEP